MKKFYFMLLLLTVLSSCSNTKNNTLTDDEDSHEVNGWTEKEYKKAMKACVKRALSYGKYDGAEDDCECAVKKVQKIVSFEEALFSMERDDKEPVTKEEAAVLKKINPLVEACFQHKEPLI